MQEYDMKYRVIRQEYSSGEIRYHLAANGREFELSGSKLIEIGDEPAEPAIMVKQSVEIEIDLQAGQSNPQPNVVAEIRPLLHPFVTVGNREQMEMLISYIQLTYIHQVFDSLPMAWIYVPYWDTCDALVRILRSACFNGLAVFPHHRQEYVREAISRSTPSVLIVGYQHFPKGALDYLVKFPNSNLRVFVEQDGTPMPLMGPKIVLADQYPNSSMLNSSFKVSIPRRIPDMGTSNPDWCTLRQSLTAFALKYGGKVKDATKSLDRSVLRKNEAILALRRVNAEIYPEEESARESLEATLAEYDSDDSGVLDRREVLVSLMEFLADPNNAHYVDDLIPLEKIAEYISESNEMIGRMGPKALSHQLHTWPGLIKNKKRVLVDVGKLSKALRSCVEIDQKCLRYHLGL
jgi:hypothetical protein